MAEIKNQKNISGLVGNLVFQTVNGKQIIRSRPAKVKQTKATKASSGEFGKCSIWSKQLRNGLAPFLIKQYDNIMYQRFQSSFYKALLSNTDLAKGQRTPMNAYMNDLVGFEFNTHSLLSSYFAPKVTAVLGADKKLMVTIPVLNPVSGVTFPDHCQHAELMVYLYATNFESNIADVSHYFILPIDKDTTLLTETIWTSPELPDGNFAVAAIKIMYYETNPLTGRNYINRTTLNPAAILFANKV
jgi:hypothetical protein